MQGCAMVLGREHQDHSEKNFVYRKNAVLFSLNATAYISTLPRGSGYSWYQCYLHFLTAKLQPDLLAN